MYYDINDILCEDQIVTCKLEIDLFIGTLLEDDVNSRNGYLKKGHIMQIPFWMAKVLSDIQYQGSALANIEMLQIYDNDFLYTLAIDPTIVNLHRCSPFYYQLGFKFADLIPNCVNIPWLFDSQLLRETLIEAQKKRQQLLQPSAIFILFVLSHCID